MDRDNIVVTYHLVFQKEPVNRAIDFLLAEMTSGIQYYSTRNGICMERIRDNVPFVDNSVHGEVVSAEEIEEGKYSVKYSFPVTNLDVGLGGISNLWAIIAGEVFNFHFIKSSRLVEIELPPSFESYYPGPRFGIEGVRKLLKIEAGPIFGSILKPNIGLDPDRASKVVRILAQAGFDFIKDDEICINPAICPLEKRIKAIADVLNDYKQKSGRDVIFAVNVTTDFSTLDIAAETALKYGAGGLMVDPFCTGLSALDYLRRNYDAPIYVHRVGYGIYCLNPVYSIDFKIFTRLFRLLGADFSHVGGIWGSTQSSREKVKVLLEILKNKSLYKQTWPVVTGISLENMQDYYSFYGEDTMFMDHIDIYCDSASSKNKLCSLKEKMAIT